MYIQGDRKTTEEDHVYIQEAGKKMRRTKFSYTKPTFVGGNKKKKSPRDVKFFIIQKKKSPSDYLSSLFLFL